MCESDRDTIRAAERTTSRLLSPQRNPEKEGHIMAKWKPTTFSMPLPVRQGVRFVRIPGWPGYAVSDNGYIWSSKQKGIWRRMIGKIDKVGRPIVTLCQSGRQQTLVVATLILRAFRAPRLEGMECCHYDGKPANNNLENLRWDTRSANHQDAVRHGTHTACRRGEEHASTRIPFTVVQAIRKTARTKPYTVVAKEFGISYQSVLRFVHRYARVDA